MIFSAWKFALRLVPAAGIFASVLAQEDERLVARWSSSSGNDVAGVLDSSGYQRHATVSGGVVRAEGFVFSGTQVLTSASALVSTTDAFTVSMWVKATNVTTWNPSYFIEANSTSTTPFVVFGAITNTKLFLDIRNSDGFEVFVFATNSIRDGTYRHVAMVSTGSTFNLYLDAGLLLSVTNNKAKIPVMRSDIGRLYRATTWANPAQATFEDIRIFNAALSAAELMELRSGGAVP